MAYQMPPVDIPADATIAQRARILSDHRHTLYLRMESLAQQGRPLSEEERVVFGDLGRQCEELDDEVMRLDGQLQRDRASRDSYSRLAEIGAISGGPDRGTTRPALLPSLREYRQMEQRALGEATDAAGGYLVPIEQSTQWFDRLRPASVFLTANPVVLDAEGEQLAVPKISGSATVQMVSENSAISESEETFGQLLLTPRKLAALVPISNEVLADSNPSVRDIVADDLTRQLGTTLDAQFLTGDGSAPNLRGVRNLSGINTVYLGANGASPTLNDVADAIGRLEASNADLSRSAVFMAPRTWATFRKIVDTQSRYQLQPDPTTDSRRQLFGVPVFISSQIGIAETRGTSSDCSSIAVCDMSRLVVARRKEIELAYSPDYAFHRDQTYVRVVARFDVGLVHAAAVELIAGVRP